MGDDQRVSACRTGGHGIRRTSGRTAFTSDDATSVRLVRGRGRCICAGESLICQSSRGKTETDSDIDLAAEFEPAAWMDLFRLTVLERRIAELPESPVDLLLESAEKRQLQDQINPKRLRAF